MLVEPSTRRPRVRARRRARQRERRLGQIDHRDACRRRADECRPARRHHRSRLAARRASPITSRTGAPGPGAPSSSSRCRCISASRAATALKLDENEATEFAGFAEAITAVEHIHDFVVIDTPGTDSYLMRLAHSMADTLITPLNDSFVDFDVLGTVDPTDLRGDRHQPLRRDGARGAPAAPPGRRHAASTGSSCATGSRCSARATSAWSARGLHELAPRLGFRCADGFAERVVYREFFPRGLTALDQLDEATLGTRPSLSHVTAREEVMSLLDGAEAAARRARPAARRGARRMVRRRRQAARGPRPDRGLSDLAAPATVMAIAPLRRRAGRHLVGSDGQCSPDGPAMAEDRPDNAPMPTGAAGEPATASRAPRSTRSSPQVQGAGADRPRPAGAGG